MVLLIPTSRAGTPPPQPQPTPSSDLEVTITSLPRVTTVQPVTTTDDKDGGLGESGLTTSATSSESTVTTIDKDSGPDTALPTVATAPQGKDFLMPRLVVWMYG